MKKSIIFMLIGCLALLVSGSIFAAPGTITNNVNTSVQESVELKAEVAPYASISFGAANLLKFTGYAGEVRSNSVTFNIETNCDAWVRGIGTDFSITYKGNEYTIPTSYVVDPQDSANLTPDPVAGGIVDKDVKDIVYPNGKASGTVTYTGTLGAISHQPAGVYSAKYTLIVWHPMNVTTL